MRGLPFLLLAALFGFGFTLGALVGSLWERNQRPHRRPAPPDRPAPSERPEPPAQA